VKIEVEREAETPELPEPPQVQSDVA
jgi:hypothetical protein